MSVIPDTEEAIELTACPQWLTLSNMQAASTEPVKVELATQL